MLYFWVGLACFLFGFMWGFILAAAVSSVKEKGN